MRQAPPLTRVPAYPVTAGIGMMATAVTLLVASGRWELSRFEVSPAAFGREPWRLVLSALPHVFDVGQLDVFHLPFNLYWLWLFGTLVEEVLGHVRALALVLLLAAGSAAAEYALFSGGIGLSGVNYGLWAMLWFLAPRDRRFAGGVDARTSQLMVAWFFLCIVFTVSKVWAVANVAHAVGALLGLLVGVAMAAQGTARRALGGAGIVATVALAYAGGGRLRPHVNLAHDAHDSFRLGYQALQDGRVDDAIKSYRTAVAIDPQKAAAWYNLGIAYESAHDDAGAVDAFRHAYQLDRSDTRHRSAHLGVSRNAAAGAAKRGDHARAIELLQLVVEIDADDGAAWHALAGSYTALGRAKEAADARAHADKLGEGAEP